MGRGRLASLAAILLLGVVLCAHGVAAHKHASRSRRIEAVIQSYLRATPAQPAQTLTTTPAPQTQAPSPVAQTSAPQAPSTQQSAMQTTQAAPAASASAPPQQQALGGLDVQNSNMQAGQQAASQGNGTKVVTSESTESHRKIKRGQETIVSNTNTLTHNEKHVLSADPAVFVIEANAKHAQEQTAKADKEATRIANSLKEDDQKKRADFAILRESHKQEMLKRKADADAALRQEEGLKKNEDASKAAEQANKVVEDKQKKATEMNAKDENKNKVANAMEQATKNQEQDNKKVAETTQKQTLETATKEHQQKQTAKEQAEKQQAQQAAAAKKQAEIQAEQSAKAQSVVQTGIKVHPNQPCAEANAIQNSYTAYTYALWLRPNSRSTKLTSVLHKGANRNERSPAIWILPRTLRLRVGSGDASDKGKTYDSANELAEKAWTHVAVVHAAGSFKIFLNGVVDYQSSHASKPLFNGAKLWCSPPPSFNFDAADAEIGDLRYYSKALTDTEIQNIVSWKRIPESITDSPPPLPIEEHEAAAKAPEKQYTASPPIQTASSFPSTVDSSKLDYMKPKL